MKFLETPPADEQHAVVVIGSGFGSSFFLHKVLTRLPHTARVLVLERGGVFDHSWQIDAQKNSDIDHLTTVHIPHGHKPWNFTLAFGGGTNCWWGNAPRMHPSDFQLRTRYGVGWDWPISYEELEPYYAEAESIMGISGDPRMAAMFPRSTPFPQPPHRGSALDDIMQVAYPEHHVIMPTGRARVATQGRAACRAENTCGLCPEDAKFTVHNGMTHVYGDPRVSVLPRAKVTQLQTTTGTISGAVYEHGGQAHVARGDLFVLGANGIFSPHILMNSNIRNAVTGCGLHEQVGLTVEVLLDGKENFDGSTFTTGVNYALFDGEHRRSAGAAVVLFRNWWVFGLRLELGRWRQTLPLVIVVEDVPRDENFVGTSDDDGLPVASHRKMSEYARRGLERAVAKLPELLRPLPVESIRVRGHRATENHIQGTLRMGDDPATSVIDANLIHHQYRNLVIVGTAGFPSSSCANPALTAAALSLRAAERLM